MVRILIFETKWCVAVAVAAGLVGLGLMPSVHPLGGGELRALRELQREAPPSRYVFTTERRPASLRRP